MSIRVFIGDHHGLRRPGLRAIVNAQADMEVVGEAASGPDAERGVKETEADVLLMQLSEREREVLGRVAEGYTNAQIANELRLGVKSVETYRGRVMRKLGFTSRSDLVRFALESGVLVPGKRA